MRIFSCNYRSGGAGNWPPAWGAYLAGALRSAGFHFIEYKSIMKSPRSIV